MGLDGLDWIATDQINIGLALDWIGLDWIGLDWNHVGLDWIDIGFVTDDEDQVDSKHRLESIGGMAAI